jgi:AcrR family transcriptional regulator
MLRFHLEPTRPRRIQGDGIMTKPTTRRGPYAKTAGRIEHILDVALELFSDRDYQAVTMKEIAERAGLSQPGLMHHFPAKADVIVALLRRRDERSVGLTPPGSALPPFERLTAIVDDIYQNRVLVFLYGVLSAEAASPEHPAHEYFLERYHAVIRRSADAFAALRQQGQIQQDNNPEILARTLIALLDGLQIQWLYHPESVDIKTAVQTFLSAHST